MTLPNHNDLWPLVVSNGLEEFLKGFGSALAVGILAVWKKDVIYRGLASLSRNTPRHLTNGEWHTAFIQNGRIRQEQVECKRVPFTNLYLGVVKYKDLAGVKKEYPFSGRLIDGLFVGTYRSENEGAGDCGSWTLKFNLEGTALIGGYSWLVKDEIGYDLYQWTQKELSNLVTDKGSNIHGVGLFPSITLPSGCMIGEFAGTVSQNPTRESLFIEGKHIAPDNNCKFRKLNHSCNPTAELRGRLIFLIKAVDPDDEITIDYTRTEANISEPFDCHCPKCSMGAPRRIES